MASAVYRALVGSAERFVPQKMMPLWKHPAGPTTVFFWAPVFKWGLVIAGLNDLKRPADKLSVGQCGSLAATGLIWSRYSLVITPKNYGLFSVNVFVAMIQLFQMYRIYTFEKPIQRALDAPETPLAIKAAPVLKK